ncbi:MAG: T9SS type A sorting domain-containing protein [Flavobacteriaceae bacterium]|nr:T9SS type A sorting domain-containing protein [Flavobacteriaceae bacterium]
MNTIACFYQLQEIRFFICKYKIVFIYLFLASTLIQNTISQTLAFPEAYGFGSNASGGRGGSVIKVTNLNASGPGSFKAAVEASGARTIIFEVGGTITLNEDLYIENDNITIAGQTAPGDGILIRGGGIIFNCNNAIVRYLRVRGGANEDCLGVTAWNGETKQDIIIDHCSASWAPDENMNVRGSGNGIVRNVTIQNSIISESGYGMLCDGNVGNISVYNNLFALNSDRNIRTKGVNGPNFHTEQINNLVYGNQRMTGVGLGCRFTNAGNHYKESSGVNFAGSYIISANDDGATISNTHAYINGNIYPENRAQIDIPDLGPYLENSPYVSTNIVVDAASSVEGKILSNVGCSYPNRDAVDERIIANWNNGNGTLATSGTYPNIQGDTAPTDTDNDGMPDFWEDDNGLNKNDPSDRNILQPDGYTNLEYYLNGLFFLNNGGVNANAGQDQNICEGQSVTLTASGGNTYLWNTGETTQSITVTPSTTSTYTVTAFIGTESDTDDVIVTVNEIPTANAGTDQTICEGETITLTATGGSSYLWNTGATSASINVSPNSTTTYSVTVTQNGCTDIDEVLVTVNSSPTANAGNDISILEGDSTTLSASGGNTYLWSTGETTQSITVNPNTTTTYSVTAFMNGCEDTDSVIVTVNAQVVANAGEDVTICENASTTLTASGGTDYLWNTGETTQSITVSPSTTTTYSVTVSNANSSDTDSVVVTVNPNPTANAGTDVTISEGESTTLTASGGGTYLWSTGETTQSITVSPNTTTSYTVTVFINGCEDSDDVIVIVENSQVVANAGEDVTICENASTTLTASGGTDYLWNTGETTQSITVGPSTTTTYSVTVSNANSSDTDSVIVTVNPNPTANAGVDVTISEGESVTLTASGGNNYIWSTGETTQNITVSPNATTTYTVIAILNGCEDSDDVIVNVETDQVVANAGADVDICEGYSVTLTASGGTDYLWSTGETTQSIIVSPNSTTTYTVIVSNESSSDTDDVTVDVNPVPEVTVSNDTTILEGNYITLSASGANNYEWSNGATQPNIAVSPSVTTTYVVTGYINNCYDVKDVTVSVVEQVAVDAGEDTSICLGDEITLTATASGAEDFLWNTGETTQSIIVSPNVDTMYTVIASNSMDSNADEIMVSVNICENEEIIPKDEDFSFIAYIDSRVSDNILNIKLTGLEDECALYLFDISGKLIHSDEFNGNDGQEVIRTINTARISDGVYIIKVSDSDKEHSKSIVIK